MKKFEVATLGSKKILKLLEEKISPEETIFYISLTNAKITSIGTNKIENLPGAVALTSQRLIFIYKVLFSHSFLYLDLSEIKSVNSKGDGLTGGHIEIQTMVKVIDILVKYKKSVIENIQQTFDDIKSRSIRALSINFTFQILCFCEKLIFP